jgi:hypothetical protein
MWPLSAAVAFLALAHLLPLFWLKPASGRNVAPAPVRRLSAGLVALFGSVTGFAEARDGIKSGYDAYRKNPSEGAEQLSELDTGNCIIICRFHRINCKCAV